MRKASMAAPVAIAAVFVFAIVLSLSTTPRTVEGTNCTDTDGGIVPGTLGIVTDGSGSNFTDNCVTNSTLTEYYCTANSTVASQTKLCKRWMNDTNSTCILGACT